MRPERGQVVLEGLRRALRSAVERLTTEELTESKVEDVLEDLRVQLVANEVSLEAAESIVSALKRDLIGRRASRFSDKRVAVVSALREVLEGVLLDSDPNLLVEEVKAHFASTGEPFPILFVGPNGGGKTTTVAKIANFLKSNSVQSVIACADTFRAAAIEQMKLLAERVGVRCVSHRYGADPAAVAMDSIVSARAHGLPAVLIDTAGRTELNRNLLEEMRKIRRVAQPKRVIYVVDALAGNVAVEQARQFDSYVGVDYVVLTKLDSDVKGGTAISVCYAIRKPIIFVGMGQELSDLMPMPK
ncbi:MAG: signal recognition particle-docking protein FtsY, partial [Aigarchaeota archaeon]|nr:signal recognition particle-docking protein FtsY [Aigarchaeota archaeon]